MCKIIKESHIHITLDSHIIIKRSTLTHRNRELQTDAFDEIREFKDNTILNTQLKAFEPAKESGLLFEEVQLYYCLVCQI